MEGVKVFSNDEWVEAGLSSVNYIEKDLKECLEGLARHLFGESAFSLSSHNMTAMVKRCAHACSLG